MKIFLEENQKNKKSQKNSDYFPAKENHTEVFSQIIQVSGANQCVKRQKICASEQNKYATIN